jgi:DNA-binding transcriptional LysR family regulator
MNMRDIDLNLLVIFDAVYSTRNISRAATQLDMSQPALSNALRRLREQLDDPLFVRKGNGVEPTPRAVELAGPIEDMITAFKAALGTKEAFDPKTSKQVFRLLIADPLEPVILPPILRSIEKQGGISIELVPPQSGLVEDLLEDHRVDVAVFLRPPQKKSLMIEPLTSFDAVLAARIDHPGFGRLPIPDLIAQYGFAALNLTSGALKNSEKIKVQARLKKRDVIQVHRISSIPQLLAKTDLLAFIPRVYAEEVAPKYGLQFIETPMPIGDQTVYLIWHRKNSEDAAQTWLRNSITAAMHGVG